MIKFHDSSNKKLTLADVNEDQFFIDEDRYLCQKVGNFEYNTIADNCGVPYSQNIKDASPETPVIKILPHVTKITWE